MSIKALIETAIRHGRLFPLMPRARGESARRAMFLSKGLWELLTTPQLDPELEIRLGALQADLEVFVTGQAIDPEYLFLLAPASEGVWEIRSVRPNPAIRVLGLFAEKDVFVATNHAFRDDLGWRHSREWKDARRVARTNWRNLFSTYQPVQSTLISDVVTGAIDGKYFKA